MRPRELSWCAADMSAASLALLLALLQPQSRQLTPTPSYENHGSTAISPRWQRDSRATHTVALGYRPFDFQTSCCCCCCHSEQFWRISSYNCPKPRHRIPDRWFILSLLLEHATGDPDISLRSARSHSSSSAMCGQALISAVTSWNINWSLLSISASPAFPELSHLLSYRPHTRVSFLLLLLRLPGHPGRSFPHKSGPFSVGLTSRQLGSGPHLVPQDLRAQLAPAADGPQANVLVFWPIVYSVAEKTVPPIYDHGNLWDLS